MEVQRSGRMQLGRIQNGRTQIRRFGLGQRVLFGISAGVVCASATTGWPSTTLLSVATVLGGSLLLLRWRGTAAAVFAAIATLSWIADGLHARQGLNGERLLNIRGTVVGLPEHDDEGARFEFIVDPGSLQDASNVDTSSNLDATAARIKRVRLRWYREAVPDTGSHCSLSVRLRAPDSFANPAGFDYAAWTLTRGIDAVGSVRKSADNRCLRASTATTAPRVLDHWRESLRSSVIRTGLAQAGVIVALALGDGSGLTTAQWRTLRATGTVHLIVVSGLHLTMIVAATFVLAKLLLRLCPALLRSGRAHALAAGFAASVALLYGGLAGFGVPTLRALLMATAALLAAALCRRQRLWPSLLLAAAGVLVVQPLAWLEPGTLLSFVGVALLLWSSAVTRDAAAGWCWRTARAWARTEGLMLMAGIPLLLLFFGQAPLSSPIGNLLAGPALSIVGVPLALLGTLMLPVVPAAGTALLQCLDVILSLMWQALDWQAQTLSVARLAVVASPFTLLAGALLLMSPSGFPGRRLALLLCVLACALQPPPRTAPGHFVVTAYDVGQGTAALIETAEHSMLVDTGPRFSAEFDAGAAVLVPALLRGGHASLDAALISHADADHSGGLASLQGSVRIDALFAPDRESAGEVVPARLTLCRAGMRWRWDGVLFQILWPHDPLPGSDNERSCVLLVSGAARALFPGDIERRSERAIMAAHPADLHGLDLLLAAHHGSRSSSSASWVQLTTPRTVIYSAASPSRFGHPHPQVVERYESVSSAQVVTGAVGAVYWRSDRWRSQGITAMRCAPRWRWHTAPVACAKVWRTDPRFAAVQLPAASDHRR